MPIYEYQCLECGAVQEVLVLSGDTPAGLSCESCGSLHVIKIISSACFVLRKGRQLPGDTCCGKEERCDTPPCSSGGSCRRS